jgi:hypothetical protein
MFNLEQSIAHWRRQMRAAGIKESATLDELENHLREEIGQQIRMRSNEQEAFGAGIRQIGESDLLKREFARVGGTRESQLRKLVLTIAFLNTVFGAWWVYCGCHSLHFLWFWRTRHIQFDPNDLLSLWLGIGIDVYGSIVGSLAIIATVQVFRWRRSGLTLTAACSWLAILGVMLNEISRVALNDFRMNLFLGLFLFLCLLYPAILLVLCKHPRVKNHYV